LIPYTDQELVKPETKPEIAAVTMQIGAGWQIHFGGVVLYDLNKDQWHSEEWWEETPTGKIVPNHRDFAKSLPKPAEIANIGEVISLLKAKL
jgi:hypothetical protein